MPFAARRTIVTTAVIRARSRRWLTTPARRAARDHRPGRRDQGPVPALADPPAQPESRGDGHRHGHPEPPADRLDVQLVGLDMAQPDPPLAAPILGGPAAGGG